MSLKKSKGNMYPWVTHMHCHLGGECSHKCVTRFGRPERYNGPLRLIEEEFKVKYGSGKIIFMEHRNDLFAEDVPDVFIHQIINHCRMYPANFYVFQTKNPARYLTTGRLIPLNSILGTTIETNRIMLDISQAPCPTVRMLAMEKLEARKFVTIEPIMDFDVDILVNWIARIKPEFVNIGADSKGHNLPEPSWEKVEALINGITKMGIEIREKHNLQRLMVK